MLVVRIRNLRGLSEHLEVRRRISLNPDSRVMGCSGDD